MGRKFKRNGLIFVLMCLAVLWGASAWALTLSGNIGFTKVAGGGDLYVAAFDLEGDMVASTMITPGESCTAGNACSEEYSLTLTGDALPEAVIVLAFYDRNASCKTSDELFDWPDYGDAMGYAPGSPIAIGTLDISGQNFSIGTTYESSEILQDYDDFSDASGLFLADKWKRTWNALEYVRRVENGVLVSGFRSSNSQERNHMTMTYSGVVTQFKADVKIMDTDGGTASGNQVFARLGVSLYNAAAEAPTAKLGNIWTGLYLRERNGQKQFWYLIQQSQDEDGENWETIDYGIIPVSGDIDLNTWYSLEIGYVQGSSQVTYTVLDGAENEIGNVTYTGLPAYQRACQDSYPALTTGMNRNTDKMELCSISAAFDNVKLNHADYDDFEDESDDIAWTSANWRTTETVRIIDGTDAVLMAESKGSRETNQLKFGRKMTHAYADVTIDGSSLATDNTARVRLEGNLYNDTLSGFEGYNGQEGQVWAQVLIDLKTDGTNEFLKAKYYMERYTADGNSQEVINESFSLPEGFSLEKGKPYRLGLNFTGTRVVFSCIDLTNNKTATHTHEITTPAYPNENEYFAVTARAYPYSTGSAGDAGNHILVKVSKVYTGTPADSDGDLLSDFDELRLVYNPGDGDMDDDGIMDGNEDLNANGRVDWPETDPGESDTDGDGVLDGIEIGLAAAELPAYADGYTGDQDTATTTDPLNWDTDGDGLSDGQEDANGNGRVDDGETDPNKSGTVSGRVTDEDGNGIANLRVEAVSNACNWTSLNGASTDDDGYYSITVPSSGDPIYVIACAECNGHDYINEWWTGSGGAGSIDCNDAVDLELAVDGDASDVNFVLTAAGTISGTVTDSSDDKNPIANLHIYAVVGSSACDGIWVSGTYTDATGKYTLSGLPEGKVYLRTCVDCIQEEGDSALPYVDEYYGDTLDCGSAQFVTVSAGETTSSIDFILEPAHTVSGRIVLDGSTDTGVANVHVQVFSDSCWNGTQYSQADTNGDGYFSISGVPSDTTVYVYVCPECNGENYIGEWHDGAAGTQDCNEAIAVDASADVDVGSIAISAGEQISGTVTGDAGVAGMWVNVYDSDGNYLSGAEVVSNGEGSGGTFTVLGLQASTGGYTVYLESGDTFYIAEQYQGTVAAGTDISFNPVKGGKIQGYVYGGGSPLGSLGVEIFENKCDEEPMGGYATDYDTGLYSITVPVGTYFLKARPDWDNDVNYLPEYWSSTGGSLDCNGAEGVTVATAGDTVEANFYLAPGGWIKGNVTDTSENPIQGLYIYAVADSACEGEWLAGTYTDENGDYTLSGLPTGKVYLRTCVDCTEDGVALPYTDEYYGNTNDCNAAVAVDVTAGYEVEEDIDFVLDQAGSITGRITAVVGEGTEGVANIQVQAFSDPCEEGTHYGSTDTNEYGYFTITNVPAGKAYVYVCPACNLENYIDGWYDGNAGTTRTCGSAVSISVSQGASTNMGDIEIEPGNTIYGSVQGETGDNPESLESAFISVHDWNTNEHLGWVGLTDGGYFMVVGLPAPSLNGYRVTFNSGETCYLWEEYEQAVPVNGTVNFTPALGGWIQGTVYRDAQMTQPLSGVDVTAFEAEDYNNGYGYRTDSDGWFSLLVPADQEFVLLAHPSDSGSGVYYEYWTQEGGTRDDSQACKFTVTAKGVSTFDFVLSSITSGDLDEDGDVDGKDLAEYVLQGSGAVTLEDLALNFGWVAQ